MDKRQSKYDTVLYIIEHTDEYTPEQLTEILSDPEIREIYNIICKADSSVEAQKEIDTDAEWDNFAKEHTVLQHRSFTWFGSRAASIAAIICTSIVAVAAGIVVTMSMSDHKVTPTVNNEVTVKTSPVTTSSDNTPVQTDTFNIGTALAPIMFEDEPFNIIMEKVSATYGVEVKFNNKETSSLHLYYKLDPALPLDVVIEQLNTFEQINIIQNGNTLSIN